MSAQKWNLAASSLDALSKLCVALASRVLVVCLSLISRASCKIHLRKIEWVAPEKSLSTSFARYGSFSSHRQLFRFIRFIAKWKWHNAKCIREIATMRARCRARFMEIMTRVGGVVNKRRHFHFCLRRPHNLHFSSRYLFSIMAENTQNRPMNYSSARLWRGCKRNFATAICVKFSTTPPRNAGAWDGF